MAVHVNCPENEHFHVPVVVEEYDQSMDNVKAIKTSALLDSRASATFISRRVVEQMNLRKYQFSWPVPLLNIDRTANVTGTISHYAYLTMAVPQAGGHTSRTVFAITDIDDQDIIISINWLRKHNPIIDWKQGNIMLTCCGFKGNPIVVQRGLPPGQVRRYSIYEEIKKMHTKDPVYQAMASFSKSQELAVKAKDNKVKSFEEMVLKQYQDYKDVFLKDKSNRLPEHKPWDLKINIKEGKELPKGKKAFPMSPAELKALKEFLKQEIDLGRIRKSESETAAPVFFIKKKDGNLRFVQDY